MNIALPEVQCAHPTDREAVVAGAPSIPVAPEVLAPAGGREQFFAALHSGADAVFLGLKRFNARARAENFSVEDLRELLPIARKHRMKVLVTLNILVKESELGDLVETLAELEDLEVDAIIVQDVAVAELARRFFPGLRLHASTQMAVHNLEGVKVAADLGFKRVVLARELTAQELRQIRRALPAGGVEIEAFCHGSLCYSYSGLCFFSGAQDSRSGNRGECAYTCRKPYRIVSEPGHGFLFSMRDLDTSDDLDLLVGAGVDTLKIEGRKKDAQYVSTVVKTYRRRLNSILGRDTLRPEAPAVARADIAASSDEGLSHDLGLTFQRAGTSFFLKGRYHENVIDLDNPTHKGLRLGEVLGVRGPLVRVLLEADVERFDGLRVDPGAALYHAKPQHGEKAATGIDDLERRYEGDVIHFSLREMRVGGKRAPTAMAGELVEIEIPRELRLPRVGDVVYKARSASLKARIERIAKPGAERLIPLRFVGVAIEVSRASDSLRVSVRTSKHGVPLFEEILVAPAVRPEKAASLEADLRDAFAVFGSVGVVAGSLDVEAQGDDFTWFIPRSLLKDLKVRVSERLLPALEALKCEKIRIAREAALGTHAPLATPAAGGAPAAQGNVARFAVKADRIDMLDALATYCIANPDFLVHEIIFEPKRMFAGSFDPATLAASVEAARARVEAAARRPVALRIAFPTVVRLWDEPLLKRWLAAFADAGVTRWDVGNPGALGYVETWNLPRGDLASDFTLYALNALAARTWAARGVGRLCLSIEDDAQDIALTLSRWPHDVARPEAILYKDTPLFLAESCSLTALHDGCPTSAVCGYRTLEVESDEGERFLVAHENCKSVVYGKEAYSVTHERAFLEATGVRDFRVDFLTRPYDEAAVHAVLEGAHRGTVVAGTHAANFRRKLL